MTFCQAESAMGSSHDDLPPAIMSPNTLIVAALSPDTSFADILSPNTSFAATLSPDTSFAATLSPDTSFAADSSPDTSFAADSSPDTSFAATSSLITSSMSSLVTSSHDTLSPVTPSPLHHLPHPSHLFRISHLVLPDGSFRGPNGRMERLTRETLHSALPSPVARSKIETVHWPRSQSKDMHDPNLRLRDLNATRQQLLKRSYLHFLGKIFSSASFPADAAVCRELAISSYQLSMVEHMSLKNFRGTTSPIEDEIALILKQSEHLLSRLKAHARDLIQIYGLFPAESQPLQAEKNRRIVTMLLIDMSFIYPDNDTARDHHYQHIIIQEIINRTWFSDSDSSVGLRMDDYFTEEMIPLAIIAHIVTVLEYVIKEWATGSFINIPFETTQYRQRFLEHLEMLQTWETIIPVPDGNCLTDHVRKQLFSNACIFANASKR